MKFVNLWKISLNLWKKANNFQQQASTPLAFFKVADTLCDSLIGGTEFFVNSLIGGATFEKAVDNFGAGLTAGVVLGSIFKIGSATIKSATLVKKSSTSSNFITEINGSKLNMCDTIEANQKAIQKRAKKVPKKH